MSITIGASKYNASQAANIQIKKQIQQMNQNPSNDLKIETKKVQKSTRSDDSSTRPEPIKAAKVSAPNEKWKGMRLDIKA